MRKWVQSSPIISHLKPIFFHRPSFSQFFLEAHPKSLAQSLRDHFQRQGLRGVMEAGCDDQWLFRGSFLLEILVFHQFWYFWWVPYMFFFQPSLGNDLGTSSSPFSPGGVASWRYGAGRIGRLGRYGVGGAGWVGRNGSWQFFERCSAAWFESPSESFGRFLSWDGKFRGEGF